MHNTDSEAATPSAVAYRVQTRQSPYFDVYHGHHVIRITVDSGATSNMMRQSTAKRLGSKIISSAHSVHQADGSSQLQFVGEIRTSFTRDDKVFLFEGLIVDVDILAGTPFMEMSQFAPQRERSSLVTAQYTTMAPPHLVDPTRRHDGRLCSVLRYTQRLWPGESLEMQLPADVAADAAYAIEPRYYLHGGPDCHSHGLSRALSPV